MENKKSKKKIKPGIIIVIIIIIIAAVLIVKLVKNKTILTGNIPEKEQGNKVESYVEEIEDGIKINKSTKLNETKELNGLKISNIQLTTKDGMTTFLADVTNNSENRTELKTVEITLLKKNGEEIAKITGIINSLEVGGSTQLNIATTSNYIEAYDFSIREK